MSYKRDQDEIKKRSLKVKQSRDGVALEALIKKQLFLLTSQWRPIGTRS